MDLLNDYVSHLVEYIDLNSLMPMKLVLNAGNGAAGPVVDALDEIFKKNKVPLDLIKLNNQPNGKFPNGIPNPMLSENRVQTSNEVIFHKADIGIAWDGDFDRCFFFDEKGNFVEGYYIVGLLAQAFLRKYPGETIVHDPRLVWNTKRIVERNSGNAITSKSGHSFIKTAMRDNNAIYGGEMSAHHYFRDFFYCDSGMIPWLLVLELICESKSSLFELVSDMKNNYPSPGEINFKVKNIQKVLDKISERYSSDALVIDYKDGISMEFESWRFNIRSSNTEPLVRLNLETRGDMDLMAEIQETMSAIITQSQS